MAEIQCVKQSVSLFLWTDLSVCPTKFGSTEAIKLTVNLKANLFIISSKKHTIAGKKVKEN
jgi:hypothetical protein